jgi:gamma-glutamylcyclotransferase (GGCT)/AIG2-like uncharacterized protein YtfP
MTLYFAYGSNMHRALMRARCPGAVALGPAVLRHWRFLVTVDGYASIAPERGACVHGVVWRLCPRDLAALNLYEGVDLGLYRRARVGVQMELGTCAALVYRARSDRPGRPRPGYLPVVIAAARDWGLPPAYVAALRRWQPARSSGAWAAEPGAIA